MLPVPTTVSRNVAELYRKALKSTKKNIQDSFSCSPYGFASTTDHWTCKWTNTCNSSFTIHYITKDWTLQNHLLALKVYPSKNDDGTFKGKTAEEQSIELKSIIQAMEMRDNDLTFVTDSENAQVKTIQILKYGVNIFSSH